MSAARPRAARRSRSSLHLLGGSLMILLGAFLPWISSGAGNFLGIRGAGLWTLYASFLGIAGAIMRRPKVVAVHAAILAVVALALPAWQLAHMVSLVGLAGWVPGVGLVLTVAGGVVAAVAATRLWREGTADRA